MCWILLFDTSKKIAKSSVGVDRLLFLLHFWNGFLQQSHVHLGSDVPSSRCQGVCWPAATTATCNLQPLSYSLTTPPPLFLPVP
ncbi:hypothetical protein VTJ04DRAFT_433 [Mycothermus thermophilus]|uniref:uncharacterized protein n=1 Tax=Humicola insolens TaxID=85995 RepID=UPI0037420423